MKDSDNSWSNSPVLVNGLSSSQTACIILQCFVSPVRDFCCRILSVQMVPNVRHNFLNLCFSSVSTISAAIVVSAFPDYFAAFGWLRLLLEVLGELYIKHCFSGSFV